MEPVLLMSIKTKYAKQIFQGIKKYEFRRKSIGEKNCNKKIYIYSSKDDKAIIGYIIIDKIFRKCRNLFFFFRFSLIILSPTKFVSSQNYIFSSFMPFDTDNTSPISAIRKITDVPP